MKKKISEMENVGEKIETIHQLDAELKELLEQESNEYKKVIDVKDQKLTITRNGKEVEVTKGELLEEVRIAQSEEATAYLKKDHPKLFEFANKREQKNQELHNYIQKEFGFSFRHMSVSDFLKLTEAVIDWKMNKVTRVTVSGEPIEVQKK